MKEKTINFFGKEISLKEYKQLENELDQREKERKKRLEELKQQRQKEREMLSKEDIVIKEEREKLKLLKKKEWEESKRKQSIKDIPKLKTHDEIVDYLFKFPKKLESGLKMKDRDFNIKKKFDLVGRDKDGILTIIEVKVDSSYTNVTAGKEQLLGYAKRIRYILKVLDIRNDFPIKLILVRKTNEGIFSDVWEDKNGLIEMKKEIE